METSIEVKVYQTTDGKQHETREKADEYVLDKVREFVDKALNPLILQGKRSQNDIYEVIMTLLPDKKSLDELDQILVDFGYH